MTHPSVEERMQENQKSSEARYGSPAFYRLLEEMAELHDKKSHDYANNDNPYGNYYFAGQIAILFKHSPEDAGFASRLAEKLYRLSILEGENKTPKNESIEDTERDIAVITALWMASRRDRRIAPWVGPPKKEAYEELGQFVELLEQDKNRQEQLEIAIIERIRKYLNAIPKQDNK